MAEDGEKMPVATSRESAGIKGTLKNGGEEIFANKFVLILTEKGTLVSKSESDMSASELQEFAKNHSYFRAASIFFKAFDEIELSLEGVNVDVTPNYVSHRVLYVMAYRLESYEITPNDTMLFKYSSGELYAKFGDGEWASVRAYERKSTPFHLGNVTIMFSNKTYCISNVVNNNSQGNRSSV